MAGSKVRRFQVGRIQVYVGLTIFFTIFARWLVRRHFLPGNWLGDEPWFPMWPGVAGIALLFVAVNAVQLLWKGKKRMLAVILIAVALAPTFVLWPLDSPRFRFGIERDDYFKAVSQGSKFGDQFEEVTGGRDLTYWRWMSWGLDNSVGIIYDPLDKLDAENVEDRLAFKSPTGGVIFRIERLDPCWYYVVHS